MSLPRQGISFILVGGAQLLIDWAVFVLLSWLGLDTSVSNVVGRMVGAGFGFWLNGRFTFADGGNRKGRVQFAKFVALWVASTFTSSALMSYSDDAVGLHFAWAIKPFVECLLATASFFVSKNWVYR